MSAQILDGTYQNLTRTTSMGPGIGVDPSGIISEMDQGRRLALLGGGSSSSSSSSSAITGPGIGVDASGIVSNIDGGKQAQFVHESLFNHQLLRYMNLPFFLTNGTRQNVALNNIGNLPFFIASGAEEDVPISAPIGIVYPMGSGSTFLNDLGNFTIPSGLSGSGLDMIQVEVFT